MNTQTTTAQTVAASSLDAEVIRLSSVELKAGMIVRNYCGRFLLTTPYHTQESAEREVKMRNIKDQAERERIITTRGWRSDYLGPVDGCECQIPAGWMYRDGDKSSAWSIQGNHNAMWIVELASTH